MPTPWGAGKEVEGVGHPRIAGYRGREACGGPAPIYLSNLPMSSILGIKYSTMPVTVEFLL